MKILMLFVFASIVSCHGTSLTFDVQRSFPRFLSGAGIESDPFDYEDGSIDSYGISLTTWIDKPQVQVELPEKIVDVLRPRVEHEPHAAEPEGYGDIINALDDWSAEKIAALGLVLAGLAGVFLIYRHKRKVDQS